MIAIGSGTAFAALTKAGATVTYWNRKSVDWRLVGHMSCGSVPASLAGLALLGFLRSSYGDSVNKGLGIAIGILLLVIASLMMWQSQIQKVGGTASAASRSGVDWYQNRSRHHGNLGSSLEPHPSEPEA